MGTYNVTYTCGCVHEMQEGDLNTTGGWHKPTGKQTQCKEHKGVSGGATKEVKE